MSRLPAFPLGPTLGIVGAFALALLVPAIWNGFPLVFSDSGVYLGSFRFPGAPPFYALGVLASSLRISLELTVLAQALLAASVVLLFFAIMLPGGVRTVLLSGLLATGLNQLPWLTSWIMPDQLAGLGVMAAILLILADRPLATPHSIFLAAVVFLAALSATANVVLLGVVVLVGVALRWALVRSAVRSRPVFLAGGAVLGATATIVAANLVIHGSLALSPAAGAMNFSRLSDIGLAQRHLPAICRQKAYPICDHLAELGDSERGQQDFLWGGLAEETGAWRENGPKYAELSARIIREAPLDYVREGLRDSVRLALVPTVSAPGDPTLGHYGPRDRVVQKIAEKYPGGLERFNRSRQQQGQLAGQFPTAFYRWSTFVSYALLLMMAPLLARRGDRLALAMTLALIVAIACEIVLHATLVGPFARYHAKLAWLPWFFVIAFAWRYQLRPVSPATVARSALDSPVAI